MVATNAFFTGVQDTVFNDAEGCKRLVKLDDKEVLETLVKYSDVQASCYKDLKIEINELKKTQLSVQSNSSKLNADLLTAVREMISAIKTIKN